VAGERDLKQCPGGDRHERPLGIPHLDPDLALVDSYGQRWLLHHRAELMLAGAYVELPAMPRASDDVPRQAALAQRPTLMRTDPSKREELTPDVIAPHNPLARDDFYGRTGWAGINGRD